MLLPVRLSAIVANASSGGRVCWKSVHAVHLLKELCEYTKPQTPCDIQARVIMDQSLPRELELTLRFQGSQDVSAVHGDLLSIHRNAVDSRHHGIGVVMMSICV
jgi:hypothetical protein